MARKSTVDYKAVITDYLLYEDCCDYHLKLILTVWDGEKLRDEVKHFRYLTTWGRKQFCDLCVNFGLLVQEDDGSICCNLNYLVSTYCAVSYYPEDEMTGYDRIRKIISIVSHNWTRKLWNNYFLEEPFRDTDVASEHEECIFPIDKYIDEIVDIYMMNTLIPGNFIPARDVSIIKVR